MQGKLQSLHGTPYCDVVSQDIMSRANTTGQRRGDKSMNDLVACLGRFRIESGLPTERNVATEPHRCTFDDRGRVLLIIPKYHP